MESLIIFIKDFPYPKFFQSLVLSNNFEINKIFNNFKKFISKMSAQLENSSINYRRVFLLLPSNKTRKMTKWAVILMILWLITSSHWSTCPSSSSTSNTITSEQFSFSTYANTKTYNVVLGPVSVSLYYLYYISTPGNKWAIRKTNPDGSLAWMAALSFEPTMKSLSVDALEQYVYVVVNTSPLDVVRLGASAGSIVDAQRQ